MNEQQLHRMRHDKGFIAALDQSGGSTPGALAAYGVPESAYANQDEMFALVHQMRSRIATSPAFTSECILGAILFEDTMRRAIEGLGTPDYLWDRKGVVPFLKVDRGLEERRQGVRLMKPMPEIGKLLAEAVQRRVFGTKMRSTIHEMNADGIDAIVKQQFDLARTILRAGLCPIVEPEVDIRSPDKRESEKFLKSRLQQELDGLRDVPGVVLKLSIPTEDDFYADLIRHPRVVRVVALSGGYSRDEAVAKLARNHGMIASFSRALAEGLSANQSDQEFDAALGAAIREICAASAT